MSDAWLYDGVSAVRHAAALAAEPGGLRVDAGGEAAVIAAHLLMHLESRRDAEVYGHRDRPGWRLGIAVPIRPDLAAVLPGRQVYGRWVDKVGLPKALAVGLAASAAILLGAYLAPAFLAPLVPYSWERRFGDALVGDFGGKSCAGGEGQAALDRLAARLDRDAGSLDIRVVDVGMVNAAALPGGNIVVFRGLIDKAAGPDEVAGILGHEIAHVRNRDVTEAMIRYFGFGALISAVGGNTGTNVNTILALRYGRDAEAAADASAISALDAAGVSPGPTAAFFERLAAGERLAGGRFEAGLEYLSSHPLSDRRRTAFLAGVRAERRYLPALSAREWRAVREICRADG